MKPFSKSRISEAELYRKKVNKIRSRAHKLWLESSEYHDKRYYWNKARHQIEAEEKSINHHYLSKWFKLIDYKCLKNLAEKLKKCSVLNIIEQLAVLTVFFGAITFISEAEQRHDELITEKKKNLSELLELKEKQNELVSSYLYALNRRKPDLVRFLNFPGYWKLLESTLEGKKIYVHNKKENLCKEIMEIQLWLPRWEPADFDNFIFPPELNLEGIILCGAKLPQATLNGVILNDAQFDGAHLKEAQLNNTKLKNSKLIKSNLLSAELNGADLTEVDLTEADLIEAKLTCTTITLEEKPGAKTEERCTNLTGANLTEADLDRADLTGADLTAANLKGAGLNEIEVNNLTKSQLKLACNWDKANYIFRQTEDKKWELDTEANQQYIEQIRQDKASEPQIPVDCSQWN